MPPCPSNDEIKPRAEKSKAARAEKTGDEH